MKKAPTTSSSSAPRRAKKIGPSTAQTQVGAFTVTDEQAREIARVLSQKVQGRVDELFMRQIPGQTDVLTGPEPARISAIHHIDKKEDAHPTLPEIIEGFSEVLDMLRTENEILDAARTRLMGPTCRAITPAVMDSVPSCALQSLMDLKRAFMREIEFLTSTRVDLCRIS